ncbi:unnamed protein product [Polarella glacialis]|uniref:Methyltransferase domain-containing protein n=2 Tax=Polarella glacialis TaxID=89957 RepID=A0A813FE85_POLGL|nr:unnamed protein product [Polarella glacialis]
MVRAIGKFILRAGSSDAALRSQIGKVTLRAGSGDAHDAHDAHAHPGEHVMAGFSTFKCTSVRMLVIAMLGLAALAMTMLQLRSPSIARSLPEQPTMAIAQGSQSAYPELETRLDLLTAETRGGHDALTHALRGFRDELRTGLGTSGDARAPGVSSANQSATLGVAAAEVKATQTPGTGTVDLLTGALAREQALKAELDKEHSLRISAESKFQAPGTGTVDLLNGALAREQALKAELDKEHSLRISAESKLMTTHSTRGNNGSISVDALEVERQAESRYWYQRREKNEPSHPAFARYGANWPCIWGEEPIGATTDGAKWTCGARLLHKPCTVYSFGSRGQMHFEEGLAERGLGCEVHIYDPTSPAPAGAAALGFKFHSVGLGPRDGQAKVGGKEALPVHTLASAMQANGHDHIDILKIDIENMEHDVVAQIAASGWPSIGQLLIEVHIGAGRGYTGKALDILIRSIEKANLRMFHHEVNWEFGATCCIEYSFIHMDWRPALRSYGMHTAPTFKELKLQPKAQDPEIIQKYLLGKNEK